MGLQQRGVGSEVSRAAGVGLDIDAPLGRIQMEGLERTGAAEVLDLIDELVTAVVAVARHALGILIGKGAAKGFDDGEGSEVLGGDKLDAMGLAALLMFDKVMDFGIDGDERGVAPGGDGIHGG